jgi:hypothetical protein
MAETLSDRQRVLFMALEAFKTLGLEFTVLVGNGQYGIRVDSMGAQLWLTNMIERAVAEPESEWQHHVDFWLAAMTELIAQGPGHRPSADEVRTGIRTRLYRADHDTERLSYARPFADGLVLGLAIDSPRSVGTVTTQSLADLSLGVNELYAMGQANTDREPIDEAFDLEDGPVRVLVGNSYFVASRVANMPALLAEHIGPAPAGVAFAVPDRHTVVYQVVDKDNWIDVIHILRSVDALTTHPDQADDSGGLLSEYLYYWAPDGTVELLGGRLTEVEGELTSTLKPGKVFGQSMGLGTH